MGLSIFFWAHCLNVSGFQGKALSSSKTLF
jgi:hypothetical protein